MELKQLDFRRSDEYRLIMANYFDLNETLKDVGDYVEERYLKRIRKQLYKEYKFTLRQAKRNYRNACQSERRQEFKNKVELFFHKSRQNVDAGQ